MQEELCSGQIFSQSIANTCGLCVCVCVWVVNVSLDIIFSP